MTDIQKIEKEMKALVLKWRDKPEAPPMSDEDIDRRFDRIKYRSLRKRLNILQSAKKEKTMFETAKEVFKSEIKKESGVK